MAHAHLHRKLSNNSSDASVSLLWTVRPSPRGVNFTPVFPQHRLTLPLGRVTEVSSAGLWLTEATTTLPTENILGAEGLLCAPTCKSVGAEGPVDRDLVADLL